MNVLVLGAGRMVESLLMGLKTTQNLSTWKIYSPSGLTSKKLAHDVGATHVESLEDLNDLDWILIGCKPQQLSDLKKTIGDKFKKYLFVSILAAVSEEKQLHILGADKLIRLMPNLPVKYGKGVCLLSSNSAKEELSNFESFFSSLGNSIIVGENELDELTLLTGSGPALFYEFSKILVSCFDSLNEKSRSQLVRQIICGIAATFDKDSSDFDKLIDNVTSKNGVTIEILEKWRSEGLLQRIQNGIMKGKMRSSEISKSIQT